MVKVRVIPTMLWKDFGLIKGVNFDHGRRVGSVTPAMKVYNSRDVDELILVDVTASLEEREPDAESVNDFAEDSFVPFTVGGGVSNLAHFQKLLDAGADKVSLNSAPYNRPGLIDDAALRYGAQCVVMSVDVKPDESGEYYCFSHSGRQATGRKMTDWLREVESRGAGEILLNAIHRDGTMIGYDLEMIGQAADTVSIPIISSGGAGVYEHCVEAVEAGASAVSAASMFHFTEQTPAGCRKEMAKKNIPVRNISR